MDFDHLFVGQALGCHYIHEFSSIVPPSKGAYVQFSICYMRQGSKYFKLETSS